MLRSLAGRTEYYVGRLTGASMVCEVCVGVNIELIKRQVWSNTRGSFVMCSGKRGVLNVCVCVCVCVCGKGSRKGWQP